MRGREEWQDVETGEIGNWDDKNRSQRRVEVPVRNTCELITGGGLFTRQHKPQFTD